jgi:L-lactate utilization protein LutB
MGLDALVREVLRDRERVDLLWRVFLETRDSRRTGMSSMAPDLLERVKRQRENSLDNLEELLQQLKASVERQGGRFHLARNRSEACEAVHRILSARAQGG